MLSSVQPSFFPCLANSDEEEFVIVESKECGQEQNGSISLSSLAFSVLNCTVSLASSLFTSSLKWDHLVVVQQKRHELIAGLRPLLEESLPECFEHWELNGVKGYRIHPSPFEMPDTNVFLKDLFDSKCDEQGNLLKFISDFRRGGAGDCFSIVEGNSEIIRYDIRDGQAHSLQNGISQLLATNLIAKYLKKYSPCKQRLWKRIFQLSLLQEIISTALPMSFTIKVGELGYSVRVVNRFIKLFVNCDKRKEIESVDVTVTCSLNIVKPDESLQGESLEGMIQERALDCMFTYNIGIGSNGLVVDPNKISHVISLNNI